MTTCRFCGTEDRGGHRCTLWCADCGALLIHEPERYAYRHPDPTADHAPRPTTRKPEAVA